MEGGEWMDWTAALSSLGTAVGIAKDLREIDRGLSQAELKARMADLYGTLSDVKIALADAREEMRSKDDEIATLKAKLKSSSALIEVRGYYYAADETGKPAGVPFCQNCLANDGTQIRPANILGMSWQCPRCKAHLGEVPVL